MEKELLKQAIRKSFLTSENYNLYKKKGNGKMSNWLFDFRISFCDSKFLDAFTTVFVDTYKDQYPFQICGLETAALPLLGAISQKMHSKGMPINAFYIRKSRKKYGRLNMIEGEVNDEKIIIIDDLMNSGSTILKQDEALIDINKKASEAFGLLAFRDENYYDEFNNKNNIKVNTIFNLKEFKEELGIDSSEKERKEPLINTLTLNWSLKSTKPNYLYVVPKSFPAVYNHNIYYGRDDGSFVCVTPLGEIKWSYLVPFGSKGKLIFSSPVVYDNKVIFGAYDGNLYCLNALTGKIIWVNFECDWIGSSPAISIKNNSVFIGAEYGFWKRKGGLVSIDLSSGKNNWTYRDMPEYTHASPIVIDSDNLVCCGSNDGVYYALDSRNGKLKWKTTLAGAIKHRAGFDDKNKIICTADHGGMISGLNLKGDILWQYKMHFGSYCIPKYYNGNFYVTSFDKHIYCINSKTGQLVWNVMLSSRIFSSVEIVNDKLLIGTNEGKLHTINPNTGEKLAVQILGERVTNKVTYDADLKNLYVLDYINNLFNFKFE